MNDQPPNPPAFPTDNESQVWPGAYHFEGLSMRDWFAGQYLTGYAMIPDERRCPTDRSNDVEGWRKDIMALDARLCYKMADAMLAERAKEQK